VLQQRRINFKQRASQIILHVPAEHIRRIKETEGIGSISRETQHFCQTTTMHGPKRIFQGKKFSTHFWILMMLVSAILLIYQVASLLSMFLSNPTVSQVSFLISEEGMDFPVVTLCNFNPIKKSYIQYLNATGDFSDELLDYLMQSLIDTQTLYSNGDRAELHVGDRAYRSIKHSIQTSPLTVSLKKQVFKSFLTSIWRSSSMAPEYVLLSSDDWGNCSTKWPPSYHTKLAYSSVNCESLCKAYYFYDRCGCSPFSYNIDVSMPMCTPYQTFQCIDQHIRTQVNGTDYFRMPQCQECQIECNSLVYHAYNSYGSGFSNGALKWLSRKNPEWSKAHMRTNFLTVNVFHRDMAHTEYRQVKATSLTEILSEFISGFTRSYRMQSVIGDIGGNMGMFLGMSLITVTEISLFISKIAWIAFSKRRRDYMFNKKKREVEEKKQLEETVSVFSTLRSRKFGTVGDSFRATQSRIRSLSKQVRSSLRGSKVSSTDSPPSATLIELQIDLRELKRQIANGAVIETVSRKRATTAPPTPRESKKTVRRKSTRCEKPRHGSCEPTSRRKQTH
ncbi:Amiloride-sensitive sodium channel, partial [Ostertagia ostertagi]